MIYGATRLLSYSPLRLCVKQMARPFSIHDAKVTNSKKPPANWPGRLLLPRVASREGWLALTCLEARLGFVDDISPATAANHAVVTVTALEGL